MIPHANPNMMFDPDDEDEQVDDDEKQFHKRFVALVGVILICLALFFYLSQSH